MTEKKQEQKGFSLSIIDRMMIAWILPTEWNLITLMTKKDVLEKTKISKKEAEEIEMKSSPDWKNVTWKMNKAKEKLIVFSESEKTFLKSILEKIEKAEKLTDDHIHIYKVFVG